jgi:O-methyltransferase involved in polyketide biosynthesis
VILDGLLEYLPERAAASLLRWAVAQLAPGAVLIATTLVPSADELLVRHLLAWPTVRRARTTLEALARGAGLTDVEVHMEHAGATLIGRAPPTERQAPP